MKGVAAGQRNGKWLDDSAGYLLALCLLGLEEAATVGEAAFQAVMLREWSGVPPTRQAFNERTAGERSYHRRDALEGEMRRLRDKLYAEQEADRSFSPVGLYGCAMRKVFSGSCRIIGLRWCIGKTFPAVRNSLLAGSAAMSKGVYFKEIRQWDSKLRSSPAR
jgi:hypothetical protein